MSHSFVSYNVMLNLLVIVNSLHHFEFLHLSTSSTNLPSGVLAEVAELEKDWKRILYMVYKNII